MDTFELADGGIFLYQDDFLPPGPADRYFHELLTNCAWEQKPGVFGDSVLDTLDAVSQAGRTRCR